MKIYWIINNYVSSPCVYFDFIVPGVILPDMPSTSRSYAEAYAHPMPRE